MDKKNIDWSNLGFGYVQTEKRFVSNFKDGKWDDGQLTDDATVVISECAGGIHSMHRHVLKEESLTQQKMVV